VTGPPTPPHPIRSVVANAVSLTGGRILLALLRFVVALVIVQRAGLERFGEFALILSFVMIAEWISDFGLGDIAVRQIAAHPEHEPGTMGAIVVSKAFQGILAVALLAGAIAVLGYSEHVVRAGFIACAALVPYAGVQIYRVHFRVRMQMGRDIGAEVLSAAVFLAGVWFATGADASLEILTLCYVGARAVNLVAAAVFAGGLPQASLSGEFRSELRVLMAAGVPLGFAGLVVAAYEAMDAIALARWSTHAELGVFTFALRIAMLAILIEQALTTAVFPLLARQWAHDRPAFVRTYQAVVDWGMVAAGAVFCALNAGALGLASLGKQDPHLIADVLQLLSWVVLAKAILTLVGPMVVISGHLSYAVWIQVAIASAKWLALMALASQGAIGAAAAYLISEIVVSLVPAVIFCQRAAGVWLDWRTTFKVVACSAGVALATRLAGAETSLLMGTFAAAAFLMLAAMLGVIRMQSLKQLYESVLGGRGGRE
jgi:O-antigen/teichoic acid export membrane protein